MRSVINKMWLALFALVPTSVFADEAMAAADGGWASAAPQFGAAFAIALAVIAATHAQGRVASAYMEGVSRNPSASKAMGTQFILGLAFIESLVLFALLIQLKVANFF